MKLTKNNTYIYKGKEIVYKYNTINYRIFEQDGKRIELSENMINKLTKK